MKLGMTRRTKTRWKEARAWRPGPSSSRAHGDRRGQLGGVGGDLSLLCSRGLVFIGCGQTFLFLFFFLEDIGHLDVYMKSLN